MTRERPHSGELKQIDKSNLATQYLLQSGMHLGNGEGMGSEVKEVIVHADGWHSQCLLPSLGNGAFNFVEGSAASLDHSSGGGWTRRRKIEQGFAIDLPVLSERKHRKNDEARRDHVVG